MENTGRTKQTAEERRVAKNARQKAYYARMKLDPKWRAKNIAYQRDLYAINKQDAEWVAKMNADRLARLHKHKGPPKPRLTEEERKARQQAYRDSYVRPEPTPAQLAKWSANRQARWAAYYANETPEQRETRLAAKAFYRLTEVQPKVLEIVEHIKFDFAKSTTEEYGQEVADEWAGMGLSCWLTAKALRYRGVYNLMEQYGYEYY